MLMLPTPGLLVERSGHVEYVVTMFSFSVLGERIIPYALSSTTKTRLDIPSSSALAGQPLY